jgi:hypothetical protein
MKPFPGFLVEAVLPPFFSIHLWMKGYQFLRDSSEIPFLKPRMREARIEVAMTTAFSEKMKEISVQKSLMSLFFYPSSCLIASKSRF